MSRDNGKEVNQAAGGDRTSTLTFRSYQQSQGGKYECRVAGPGNNTERLAVCIGECCSFLLTLKHATCDSGVFLLPRIHHLCCVHTMQTIAHVVASLSCVRVVSLTKLEKMVGWLAT